MGTVDAKLARSEKKARNRQEAKIKKREVEEERFHQSSEKAVLGSSSEEEQLGEDPLPSTSTSTTPPMAKRSRKSVVSPQLASALDRAKVNDSKATFVLVETVKSLGHEVTEYTISRCSIRRDRRKHREQIAGQIKAEFTADVPLLVH